VETNDSASPKKPDPKEQAERERAAREMRFAAWTIGLSFVFVFVVGILIVLLGHIRLF